jgi:glycosyltransferase involved in cell wall biosynthesis
LKITFVIPIANLSGGIRIVSEHARMLHELGHTVTVVAGKRSQPSFRAKLKAFARRKPIPVDRTGPTHLDDVPFTVHTIDRSRPITANDVPDSDLILATWWETAEWVWSLPARKGVKVNLLQGYEAFSHLPKDRVDAVWRLPMQKIVVSEWLNGIAKNQFHDDSAILVPNGLDTTLFSFNARGLTGRRVIGAMYSPAYFKRFGLACKIVETLRKRGQDCEFIGFGASQPDSSLLPEGARFEVAPTQELIAEIYGACDCWLFTSDKEGYGLPLLEAMACGTPVVATPAGAAPELLESGGGELVKSSDPVVLADAVERVLTQSDEDWRIMSRKARSEAERHSWTKIGDQMEKALMKCLSNSQKM